MMQADQFDFDIRKADGTSIYLQFKAQLLANINRLKLTPGSRLPDITALAQQAGISVRTAYMGINELIKDKCCFKQPKKGTFVADPAILPSPRKRICALYHQAQISLIEHSIMFSQILKGLRSNAEKQQIDIFYMSGDIVNSLEFYLKNKTIELTGVIFLEFDSCREGVRLAQIFPELRFIFVNYYNLDFDRLPRNIFGVFNDDFSGGFQIGEYLWAREHRRFGTITIEQKSAVFSNRIAGFRQAIKLNGGDSEGEIIECSVPDEGPNALRRIGYSCAARMAAAPGGLPPAIFAVNDFLADGALKYLREHKLEDKSELFGYDHVLPSLSLDGNFSTAAIDFVKMGKWAIDLAGNAKNYSRSVLLQPQLLIHRRAGGAPECTSKLDVKSTPGAVKIEPAVLKKINSNIKRGK